MRQVKSRLKSACIRGEIRSKTHLESNVIVPHSNFELLFPDNVLFWPIGVVFPASAIGEYHISDEGSDASGGLLRDFA